MDAAQWEKLDTLFGQALELPAGARTAFLADACGADEALREELSSLLGAYESSSGYFAALAEQIVLPMLTSAAGESEGELRGGQTVAHYEVAERLGGGGMGVVYRARDLRLDRPVALKILPSALATDDAARARLVAEAKAVSALDHSNIAVVYEIGETASGVPFIAMAWYEGETLKQRLARGPLQVPEALALATQLAAALAAAHRAGIVHRDIKPANVLITADGVAKLLDFGIAKVSGAELTKEGTTLGTVAYMSPEQTRGQAVDARTDLWSLGVVLYEMLAGRRPFPAEDEQALIYAIRHDEPEPLPRVAPQVPAALAHVVAACLAKAPARRYPSAEELARALGGITDPADSGGVLGMRRRRASTGRRRIGQRGVLGGVAALVLTGIVAGVHLTQNAPASRDEAASTRGAGVSGETHAARSIVVLPFTNLSPDEADENIGDGITEEITARLAQIAELRVISRTSATRYKDSPKSMAAIAEELDVSHVLQGSVSRAGDRLRITVQLLDPRREAHLWSETYERTFSIDGLFRFQSDLAQQVARALRAEISPAERRRVERIPTRDLAAYDLYLRGRESLKTYRLEAARRAIHSFERALELDPRFALAEAARGEAYGYLWRFTHREEFRDSAHAAYQRVLQVDPELPEGHHLMGLHHASYGRRSEAYGWFRRALELHPNHPATLSDLARVHAQEGRLDLALPLAQKAAAVAPTSILYSWEVLQLLVGLGELEAAERWIARTLRFEPSLLWEHSARATLALRRGEREQVLQLLDATRPARPDEPSVLAFFANMALLAGDPDAARSDYEHLRVRYPQRWEEALTGLAYVCMRAGERQRAEALLEEAVRGVRRRLEQGDERSTPHVILAQVHTLRGESESALQSLETAYAQGWRDSYHARFDPRYDPLRGHPRFERLMAGVEADLDRMRLRVRELERP